MIKIVPEAVNINRKYLLFMLDNTLTLEDYKKIGVNISTLLDIATDEANCTLYAITTPKCKCPKLFVNIETDNVFIELPVPNETKNLKKILKNFYKEEISWTA